ncbi:DEAD/DEAH box helicase [Candidatus Poribacteria bacterium]|nr:DEAD/DEAH box helicase [Candidatus Poribacteria bacterium]
MTKIHLHREPKLQAKLSAFSYQHEAFEAIKDLEYAAIFHEQGLGKTKIAIDLMIYWLEKKVVDTVLFVTKKHLLVNWQRELTMHSHISPRELTQNRAANFYAFNSPARAMLAHYEVFRSELRRLKLFLRTRDVGVILDESTKIKNPDTDLTKAFFELAPFFKKRVIMTGTPVANRPEDIWAQVYFLDQGENLGNDFSRFKREVDLSNKLVYDEGLQTAFEAGLQKVQTRISAFSVRENKNSGVISLPKKHYQNIYCDWEHKQFDLYRQVRDTLKAVVIKEGVPTLDRSDDILKRLLRLVQIASNPAMIDGAYRGEPGKLDHLLDLVTRIRAKNEKGIVWTTFTENADWLCGQLGKYNAVRVHGHLGIQARNLAIKRFLEDLDIGFLVATPGAAKEGLTLTVANHVIFYDRNFSLDDYLQAQDRIHRISQAKECYVYNLLMPDSIDEWIGALIHAKHLSAQLLQGDITEEFFRSEMTYDFGHILKSVLKIDREGNDDRPE